MTMTIPADGLHSGDRPGILDTLGAAWGAHRRRRAHRAALRHAAHLGPRLLADMGIDPALIRGAADPWDQLPGNGILLLPR